jgi:hypothetical protein
MSKVAPIARLVYFPDSTRRDALELADILSVDVGPVETEMDLGKTRELGGAELVLEIVASASAKVAIEAAIRAFANWLRQQREQGSSRRGQVLVKPADPGKRPAFTGFNTEKWRSDLVDKAADELVDKVVDLVAKAI